MADTTSHPDRKGTRLHPKAVAEVLASLDQVEEDAASDEWPRIGGFRIVKRIDSGGGGVVYLAFREQSDQPLAIKVLHARPSREVASRRAWRELDILREIRHESVPRLLDHGEIDGQFYFVTEYIDGIPIDLHCAKHKLDQKKRVDFLARLADVVQALHEFRVIHRDIKPDNILIDAHGRPVLVDLGIATLFDGCDIETLTLEGEPIGTPLCMSPEQARGERESISTRSDVYGLGATGYLLLTDHAPHDLDAPVHEVARRIGNDEPRDPCSLKPTLPKPLAAVLRKAVAHEPRDRYASAAEFAEDLRRWMRREPVIAQDVSWYRRVMRSVARHPIVTVTGASLFIAGMIFLATWLTVGWLNSRPAGVHVDSIDRSWVQVHAYSGRILKEWNLGYRNAIAIAEVAKREPSLGGGNVLVLGMSSPSKYRDLAQVFLYDLDDLDEPYWSSGTKPPDIRMPEPISRIEGELFKLEFALVADVFPQSPGQEVIAVHTHALFSPNLIRIYSLSGDVLWELWHDGGILSGLWVPEGGILVLSGFNSENNWRGRGFDNAIFAPYPLVAFAVKPQLGDVRREWVRTPGGLGTVGVEWYQCLMPPQALEAIGVTELGLHLGRSTMYVPEAGSDEFHLKLSWGEQPLLTFVMDGSGREIRRERQFEYGLLDDPPDPEALSFGELPPLLVDPLNPGK